MPTIKLLTNYSQHIGTRAFVAVYKIKLTTSFISFKLESLVYILSLTI